jgi:transposase
MPQQQRAVTLTRSAHQELEIFVTRGKQSARAITRARILLLGHEGRGATDIARLLGVTRRTVYNVWQRYKTKAKAPLWQVLQEGPRPGRPLKLDSRVEAQVTRLACAAPPAGRARWTLHLLADKVVKLGLTDSISHESVRQLLKKPTSSPGSRNSGA